MSIVEKAAAQLKRQDRQRPALLTEEDAPVNEHRADVPKTRLELDDVHLRRVNLLPPESAGPWISRELQRIKRPVINAMSAEIPVDSPSANRLMITSANPGDGKSFAAFNLALSLADELDYSVLLIDGDVAKQGISRNLGLEDKPGLMHLLRHTDIDPEDCVVATSEPRLSILPAGQRSRRAAESLSSRRMKAVLDELSADPARILVFDSSPLLATAESQTLALNVGQILFVVRAEHTEKRAVEAALSLIEPTKAEISLILSQGHQLFDERYSGYYGIYPTAPTHPE